MWLGWRQQRRLARALGYALLLIAGFLLLHAMERHAAPTSLINPTLLGGLMWMAGALIAGTRESATLNAFLVVAKLIALAVFVAIALPAFDASNLQPFMPHGFAESIGPDGKISKAPLVPGGSSGGSSAAGRRRSTSAAARSPTCAGSRFADCFIGRRGPQSR